MKFIKGITRKYFGTLKGWGNATGWMKKHTANQEGDIKIRPVTIEPEDLQLVMWDELREIEELQEFFKALCENSDEPLETPKDRNRWTSDHPIDNLYHLVIRRKSAKRDIWGGVLYEEEPYFKIWLYDAVGNLNNLASFLTLEYAAANIKRLGFEQVYVFELDDASMNILELLHDGPIETNGYY